MVRDLSETPIPGEMEGELRSAFDAFRTHHARVRELTQGLSDARFNRAPEDPGLGTWSVGECLHHLNLTARGYLNVMTEAIEQGRSRGVTGRGPFRHGRLSMWMVRQLEPPVRRKYPAPRPSSPVERDGDLSLNEVVEEFVDHRRSLFRALEAADGLALDRVRVQSPFIRPLRFDLGIAFAMLAAHERRHLLQAERVRGAPGFPAA